MTLNEVVSITKCIYYNYYKKYISCSLPTSPILSFKTFIKPDNKYYAIKYANNFNFYKVLIFIQYNVGQIVARVQILY